MAVPATVIYFTSYDQLCDYLRAQVDSQGRYIPLVAGAVARREYHFLDLYACCFFKKSN